MSSVLYTSTSTSVSSILSHDFCFDSFHVIQFKILYVGFFFISFIFCHRRKLFNCSFSFLFVLLFPFISICLAFLLYRYRLGLWMLLDFLYFFFLYFVYVCIWKAHDSSCLMFRNGMRLLKPKAQ